MSDEPRNSRWSSAAQRGLAVPIMAVLFFGALVTLFHEVLLPFVMALIIVYLMEPMVKRMTGREVAGRHLPRWAAVISVYVTFFTAITVFMLLFVPPLTVQVGEAAEEIPDYFNELREEHLPRWSAKIETLLGKDKDEGRQTRPEDVKQAVQSARVGVAEAFAQAASVEDIDVLPVLDTSGAQPLLRIGEDRIAPMTATEAEPQGMGPLGTILGLPATAPPFDRSRVALTLVPDPEHGGLALVMGESDLRIVPAEDGSFLVRMEPASDTGAQKGFDLETEIIEGLGGVLESGSEYAGDLLELVQFLLIFILNAFVMIVLMFMVAAFISIDLPRIMAFVRSLVPGWGQGGYDELMSRLNRGLAGVIRGQLVICAINGTLTGIGLWVLDVDFALMLGIIAGVLSLIPVFGTIISTIPAVLIALTQSASTALMVLVWIMIVHFFDANFFTPKIVGSSSELHPVTIIFALLAGESAFGLFGALLAVPVASIVQTVFLFCLDRVRDDQRQLAPTMVDIPQQPRPALSRTQAPTAVDLDDDDESLPEP